MLDNVTSTFTAVDDADNRAILTLLTMVVDTQSPVWEYASNYNTSRVEADRVLEVVEASREEGYVFGRLSAVDPPFGTALDVEGATPSTAVNRGGWMTPSSHTCSNCDMVQACLEKLPTPSVSATRAGIKASCC